MLHPFQGFCGHDSGNPQRIIDVLGHLNRFRNGMGKGFHHIDAHEEIGCKAAENNR